MRTGLFAAAASSGSGAGAPGVVTNVAGTQGVGQIGLTWSAPVSNGGSAITDYIVQYSSDSGSTWTTFADSVSATASATVTGLTNGTSYVFRVLAQNAIGDGPYSATSAAVTNVSVPTAPTSLSASPGINIATISFTAPSNDGSSAITNYEYSFNGSSWTALSPADAASPITVSGLTANTAYNVYLRAVNIAGSGPASSATSFTTSMAAPSAVELLIISGGGGGGGNIGGGGGAGGYRTSVSGATQAGGASLDAVTAVQTGTTYSIYVGAGGTGAIATLFEGSSSGPGSFSAFHNLSGSGGGQGGYSGFDSTAGSGGNAGDFYGYTGRTSSGSTPGGGGGAGAIGATIQSGGNGLSNSITGTAILRGGGGGGGAFDSLSQGSGGTGGGGNGAGSGQSMAPSGTVNTGGGGGGGRSLIHGVSGNGGAGGSGIVILRYPDSYAAAVATAGSPTVTVTGGYRIYQFTGSGSITF